MADGSRAGSSVPSSNRGLKSPQGAAAIVDYCTLTASVDSVRAQRGVSWVESVFRFWIGSTVLRLDGECRGMRNYYANHWRIVSPDNVVVGFIAVGGQNGTYCFQLSGQGCAYVSDWHRFADRVDDVGANLTRVDCAHDDFEGTHPLSWACEAYKAGEFVRGGRPPKGEFTDDYGSGDGCTLYVGKNSGNQTLCVYEKGKQLGDKSSPWVRYEGRFGAKYRVIPSDVLRRPGEFLAGMFPVLAWISAARDQFRTAVKKTQASLVSLATHARRQYGRFLNFAKSIHVDDYAFAAWVSKELCRSGLPGKLKIPHVGAVVSAEKWRSELCASW